MKLVICYLFNVKPVHQKWKIAVAMNVKKSFSCLMKNKKELDKGIHNSNKIFKKGRSEKLKFKK